MDPAAHAGRPARPPGRLGQQHRDAPGTARVAGRQGGADRRELARLEARYAELFASGESDAAFADSVFTAALGDTDAFSSRDAATGNYNQFWLVDRDFDNRTSLVVDPPDGRLPPLTPEAQRHVDARAAHLADNPASSWTDRRLQERCITFGMPNLFAGYNTYYRIVQTPDHVVFLHEMIHDARIVPIDAGPHVDDAIRQWHGDARGYWDGDTLVVETRNFSAKSDSPAALYERIRGSAEQLRLVERFTRVGPRYDRARVHGRRPGHLLGPVDGDDPVDAEGRGHLRVRLPTRATSAWRASSPAIAWRSGPARNRMRPRDDHRRPTRRDPPAPRARAEYPQMELKGTVTVTGDIVKPVVPEGHWDSLRPPRAPRKQLGVT